MDYIISKFHIKINLTSLWVAGSHIKVINEEEVGLLALGGRGQLPWASEGVCCPVFELHDLSQHGIEEELTVHGL